jgi:hypothetical protein
MLLQQAAVPPEPAVRRHNGPFGTIKRKGLILEARLLASRYGLWDQVDEFVYANGHEAITGLAVEDLERLVAAIKRMGSDLDAVCDPRGAPPAR